MTTPTHSGQGRADGAAPGQNPAGTPAHSGDDLSEEDLELAAQARAASNDWDAGPPPGRANAFWPSFTRMVGLLGAYKMTLVVIVVSAVLGVVLSVAAPKVLGQATNVVFEGVISSLMPLGTTKDQAVAALQAQGMDDFASMVSAMDIVPGAGIDFDRLARILILVLGL